MKITKLKKEVFYTSNPCTKLTVEIEVSPEDMRDYDYQGFDMVEDEMIPDILLAASRLYRVTKGKLELVAKLYGDTDDRP